MSIKYHPVADLCSARSVILHIVKTYSKSKLC